MIPDPDAIAFAGDWHENTYWMKYALDAVARSDVHVVLHVGDLGFKFSHGYMRALRRKLVEHNIHLFFVDGNHDEHPQLFYKWGRDKDGFGTPPYPAEGADRIHYIPRGKRWTWWGKTFMGLGGAHSVDRQGRTPYVDWWPQETITTGDYYRAVHRGKVDVMVTHDLPSNAQLPNDRKSSYWPEAELIASEQNRQMLQAVVDEVQPELLVHGHFHQRFEQQVGGLHIVGLDRDMSSVQRNLYIIGPDMIERSVQVYSPSDYPSDTRTIFDK